MKKIAIVALMLLIALNANAQWPRSYKWFATLGGGAQLFWGEEYRNASVGGDLLSPAVSASVGRHLNHVWALRAMYQGYESRSLTTDPCNAYANGKLGHDQFYRQKFGTSSLQLDIMFNLSSAVCYYPRRFYECIPYLGVGAGYSYRGDASTLSPSATLGLYNRFRLCRRWDLNLDLSASMYSDNYNKIKDSDVPIDVIAMATVGLTYKF